MKSRKLCLPACALLLCSITVYSVQEGKIINQNKKILHLKEAQSTLLQRNAELQHAYETKQCVIQTKYEPSVNMRIDMPITNLEKIDDELFREVARQYPDIDSGFAYANFLFETGHGTSVAWVEHNNPAGIISLDGSGQYRHFESKEEGLQAMFNLIRYYCVNGRNTPTTLRSVWAEVPRTEEIVEIWKDIYE